MRKVRLLYSLNGGEATLPKKERPRAIDSKFNLALAAFQVHFPHSRTLHYIQVDLDRQGTTRRHVYTGHAA